MCATIKLFIVVFDLFYQPVKSLFLRMISVFKQQDLQMFGLKLNKSYVSIFTQLVLLVAVARHNFKWVKFK